MADNATVHIGENSPEQVAYKLMHDIALAEKMGLGTLQNKAMREWIIKTYTMCRQAVSGHTNVEYVLGLGK